MNVDTQAQWYNQNEGRSYPLAEESSGLSDAGLSLPDDILVDLGILVPEPIWPSASSDPEARISSLRISPSIISLSISTQYQAVLAGTYVRSQVEAYKAYPLTAMVDNVSGWVAFGNHRVTGVEDYRFATYAQSGLAQRAVRVCAPPGIEYLYHAHGLKSQKVDGIVHLEEGPGVHIEYSGGQIVVRLDETARSAMVGPCNEPADEDTCGVPPLRSINGVPPDANGRIIIRFE